ncbi:tetratricopeptide repeat protein [Polaribacter litorisediminis]|uniref:tetratricopeptide repeat protein n=1 Tax=Polaribacter litorisediminis TaxID=1908341 RepID=UPI001CC09D22|nr:tetratricopeptide repeat protein [Polaribacter litorisediminis]UAM97942.1 tetratricopeptide repeat protein [Polaribacter litorisediminis]
MKITFTLNTFLYTLFPVEKNNVEQLKSYLKQYYTLGPFEPKIEITDKVITITVNTSKYLEDKNTYQQLVNLCENGSFHKAKPLAEQLIQKSPNVSEYHRILGQILSEQGDQEEAINCLIDALRWNPSNKFALLMMGNIFAKFKKDNNTANIYYNQVLVNNPNDHITLVNIGVTMFQQGQQKEALKYLNKAIEAQPDYPNTYMALTKIAETNQDWQTAITNAIKTLKRCLKKDVIYQNALHALTESCNNFIEENNGASIINNYKVQLETTGNKNINIVENNTIENPAKIEIAEYHKKEQHNVFYKSNYKGYQHLVMHELVHLDFVLQARKINENQLFTSDAISKDLFLKKYEKSIVKKLPQHLDADTVNKIVHSLFHGINSRAYNAPIDLFIEDFLYNTYPALRPFQFISLMYLIKENINAVTDKAVLKTFPNEIISKNRIYNVVMAMHFKELFGVDSIEDYKANKVEMTTAKNLYKEFKEYQNDRKPAEEYELVQHWAEDLDLHTYFQLIPENPQDLKTVEGVMAEMQTDPYGINSRDKTEERNMKAFLNQHADNSINKAVAMYMVGALQYFKPLPTDKVKVLAFEFATLGIAGIDPNKDNYSIPSIKNKTFTGYQTLAYYYTSWAIAIPNQLAQLQLPFDKEFALAKKITEL